MPVVRHDPLAAASLDPPPVVVAPAPTASAPRRLKRLEDAPSSAELELLSRAQAAYSRGELSRALMLIAEHGRRFPNGHLAEEREALRVRSLARSGREEESGRADIAFRQRFPRSVLSREIGNPNTTIAQ